MQRTRRASTRGRSGLARACGIGLALLLAGCGDPVPQAQRIVLITIDTLRADHVGAYGDEQAYTPTLDELASAGTRFANAIAPTPTTLPSHTSIMTGLDPHQHGVRANGRFSLGDDVPTLATRMKEAGFSTGAFVGAVVLRDEMGLARGFDVYDDDIGSRKSSPGFLAVPMRTADKVVNSALAWIREGATERFFLWVHLYDPHAEYTPPPGWADKAGDDPYRGEIAFADSEIRRLLLGIQRRFGSEDLLVAVTADHGESLGEHDELTHSHTLYEATQHVPLILAGPGIPRKRVVEQVVRLIDVAPTLIARAGARPLEHARGRDLTPLLYGGEHEETPAYLETLETQLGMGWSPLLGLRTATHKYIRAPVPELYDLAEDPAELSNVAELQPELAHELDDRLSTLLAAQSWEAPSPDLSDVEREQLVALGYLGAASDSTHERPLGVVGGTNPRDYQHEVQILLRASTAVGQGRGALGLTILDTMQSRDGDLYHRVKGTAALQARDPARAREAADWLLTHGAERYGLYFRGAAAQMEGDLEAARHDLEACAVIDPVVCNLSLGAIEEKEDHPEEAEAYYRKAFDASEGLAVGPRLHLAALYTRQERFDEAAAMLEGQEDVVGSFPQPLLRLVAAEQSQGRIGRARHWVELSLSKKPFHLGMLQARAFLQERSEEFTGLLKTRRRLQLLDPDDPTRKADVAWALVRAEDDLDEALRLAEEAAEEKPSATTLAVLAFVRLSRKEWNEAIAAADRSLGFDGGGGRALVHLIRASALAATDRKAEARAALDDLEAEPDQLIEPWSDWAVALAKSVR